MTKNKDKVAAMKHTFAMTRKVVTNSVNYKKFAITRNKV